MAGPVAESRVSPPDGAGRFAFRAAGASDADAVNRLLADTPVGGQMAVSLERAPDPFAADFGLSDNHLIVLGEERCSGRLAGMCERTVLPAFVNGTPAALPYIGALRVAPEFRNRVQLIRGGFAALREKGERLGEQPFALTSITADNDRALRLLTAGVAGLPSYRPVGDYSTLFLRARKQRTAPYIRRAGPADMSAIAAFLNHENRQYQFAPVWSARQLADLAAHGLAPGDFLIAGDGARLTGCIALWDQSARRQAIVRTYPKHLSALRHIWNLAGPLTRLPHLPGVGAPLKQAVLSHCAVAGNDEALFLDLIRAALNAAGEQRLSGAYIGLASANPLVRALNATHRTLEYTTLLHTVHWADAPAPAIDPKMLAQPEAGLM